MSLISVVGQNKIAEMLLNSIKVKRVSHAYIFSGTNGVGKSKMAIEFAKALNCQGEVYDACNTCQNCKRIEHHNHQDVVWLSPEGNSIKIEQIRQLQRESNYKLSGSRYKIIIIEHADKMTNEAANSLLKFLEEPNSSVVTILLVENIYQLIKTIISRCQTIYFPPLNPENLTKVLLDDGFSEGITILAAHISQDIEEVKELVNSESFAQMRNIMIQWSEDVLFLKYQALFTINDKVLKNDYIKENIPQFLDLLIMWYRDILNIKLNRKSSLIYKDFENILSKQGLHETEEKLISKIDIILQTKKQLASYANPQLALENMVLSLWEG